jgi:hypothetical protein
MPPAGPGTCAGWGAGTAAAFLAEKKLNMKNTSHIRLHYVKKGKYSVTIDYNSRSGREILPVRIRKENTHKDILERNNGGHRAENVAINTYIHLF